MKRIKQILKRILFPSKMKLICIPVVSFIILIFILIKNYAGISDLLYVGIFACNLAIGCTITDKTDKISYNK